MKATSLVGPLIMALGLGLVAWARPSVSAMSAKVREKSDAYSLPPARVLGYASLGYRSALADLIWAHVLVTQGLRMGERRPFDHLELYIEAITHLEPSFREPYRLADSLFAYQMNDKDRDRSVHVARGVLEKGLRERPYDAELWLGYGQFLAYIAPGMLKSVEEQAAWRSDGAKALVRAGELGGQDSSLLWKSVAALRQLTQEGETDAAVRFLERTYGMTEDPELKDAIARKLQQLYQGKQASRAVALSKAFEDQWRRRASFLSRYAVLELGPEVSPWACSGSLSMKGRDACARDWNGWSRVVSPEEGMW